MPCFSIVVPVYNRQQLLPRCIGSCLRQAFADLEVVVVDDGSTDASRAAASHWGDPRVRLVTHRANRGYLAARATGVAHATGEWVVFLDSDDELLPGALEVMRSYTARAPEQVGRVVFMYRLDDGTLSPQPPLPDGILDYAGYIRWTLGLTGSSDVLNCLRRATFGVVPHPERPNHLTLYFHDFAAAYRTQTVARALAALHSDAANRMAAFPVASLLVDADHLADCMEAVLARHGDRVATVSRRASLALVRRAAVSYFLAGRRRAGMRQALRCVMMQPGSLFGLGVLLLGLAGPRLVARALSARARARTNAAQG